MGTRYKPTPYSGRASRRAAVSSASSASRQAGISARRTQATPVYRSLNRRAVASKETGFVDTAEATYAMNTTGSIALIPTVAQGASTSQRIGKKIVLKSLQIRGVVTANATTVTADGAWLIVYDRRPTGSLPAITDILVTANSRSMNNDANSGRFKILKRSQVAVIGNTTTAGQQTECSFHVIDEYLKLKGLPIVYKAAATGGIGDIEQGALYIVTVGSVAASTADADAILAFRTRYYDV